MENRVEALDWISIRKDILDKVNVNVNFEYTTCGIPHLINLSYSPLTPDYVCIKFLDTFISGTAANLNTSKLVSKISDLKCFLNYIDYLIEIKYMKLEMEICM